MTMNINDPYLAYYRNQQLGRGVGAVYQGAPFQRGYGVGSFLGGLFRSVVPILKSGMSTLGKEALRTGVGILGDISSGTIHPRDAASARLKQLTSTLKRKADGKLDRIMSGGGSAYKRKRISRVTPQSLAKLLRVKTSRSSGRRKKRTTKKRSTTRRRKAVRRMTGGGGKRKTTKRKTIRKRRRVVRRRQDIFV